ncbi:MAG: hypothetical protein ABIT71_22935 [Vicinamibacteraceae bacterium]
MALALTLWGWSGLVASFGVILALWARHAWRAAVREELVAYLAHAAPEVAVMDVFSGALVYQARDTAEAPRTLPLREFYRHLGARPGGSAEAEAARLEVFAAVVIAMRVQARGPADAVAPLQRAS